MASLDFPTSPYDGQRYTFRGVSYVYNAAVNAWVTDLIQVIPWANTVNTQIIYNDDGASNGSYGLIYDRAANTFRTNTSVTWLANATTLIANTIQVTGAIDNVNFTGTVSTGNSNILSQTLTDGTIINWDTSQGVVAQVTLGGNRTIAAPTNMKVSTYILHIYQDSTGGRTLSWDSVFKWPAGEKPILTANANAHDVVTFVSDGTYMYSSFLPDVK